MKHVGHFTFAPTFVQLRSHSCPQRPRFFWSAPRIKTSVRLQHPKFTIHGLFVKCGKSDCTLHMLKKSAPARGLDSNLDPRVSPALCQWLVAGRNSGMMEFL